jgi:NAD(P)-dependent dehydrogenase (short-subunit alcohol dehydrogenase family)
VNKFSVRNGVEYAVSKAALNALVAKYNTVYGAQGILFMAISPGFVDTSEGKQRESSSRRCSLTLSRAACTISIHKRSTLTVFPTVTPEEFEGVKPMLEAFTRAKPDFAGPITSQESVDMVLKLAERATVEDFGGAFVSHFGNQQWL